VKPGAEQMAKTIHLICTLFLHISPDSQCLHGSCCTVHKKLTCQWIWHLGLPCRAITPLPLRSEKELPASLSAPLTVTIDFEKAIQYHEGHKKAVAMQLTEVRNLEYSLEAFREALYHKAL